MDSKQARAYLAERGLDVKQGTLLHWYRLQHVDAEKIGGRWLTTEEALDRAIHTKNIPPRAGRRRRFSREDREAMCKMHASGKTLKEIASRYGCDQSYVSLLVRGLR
jgi:hypothetical protein